MFVPLQIAPVRAAYLEELTRQIPIQSWEGWYIDWYFMGKDETSFQKCEWPLGTPRKTL